MKKEAEAEEKENNIKRGCYNNPLFLFPLFPPFAMKIFAVIAEMFVGDAGINLGGGDTDTCFIFMQCYNSRIS